MVSLRWVALLVALNYSVYVAHSQCVCRTPQNCPQAIFNGKIVACRLPAGKFGLCCSPKPSAKPTQAKPQLDTVKPAATAQSAPPKPQVSRTHGDKFTATISPSSKPGTVHLPPFGFPGSKPPPGVPFGRPPPPPFLPPPHMATPPSVVRTAVRPKKPKAEPTPAGRPIPPPRRPVHPGFGAASPYGFPIRQLSPIALSARSGLRSAGRKPPGSQTTTSKAPKPAARHPFPVPGGRKPPILPYGFFQAPGRNYSSLHKPGAAPISRFGGARIPLLRPPGPPGSLPPGFRPRGLFTGRLPKPGQNLRAAIAKAEAAKAAAKNKLATQTTSAPTTTTVSPATPPPTIPTTTTTSAPSAPTPSSAAPSSAFSAGQGTTATPAPSPVPVHSSPVTPAAPVPAPAVVPPATPRTPASTPAAGPTAAAAAAGSSAIPDPAAVAGLPVVSPSELPTSGAVSPVVDTSASSVNVSISGPLEISAKGPSYASNTSSASTPSVGSLGAPAIATAATTSSSRGVPSASSLGAPSVPQSKPSGPTVPPAGAPNDNRKRTSPILGQCVPLIMCPPMVAKPELLYHGWCRLRDGSPGIICNYPGTLLPGIRYGLNPRSSVGVALGSPLYDMHPMRYLTTGSHDFLRATDEATPYFAEASLAGETVVNELVSASALMISLDQIPDPNSPTAISFLNSRSTFDTQEMGLGGLNQLAVADGLRSLAPGTLSMIPSQGPVGPHIAAAEAAEAFLAGVQPAPTAAQLPLVIPDCELAQQIFCEPEMKYRTTDGTCNNPDNARLGSQHSGFKRLLPNTFDDGLFAMRTRSIRGGVLPSARLVSERVLDTLSNELRDFTLSLMQFSQFVDHDLSQAPTFRLTERQGIECCLDGGRTFPAPKLHQQCIPIPIPPFDPFYSQFGQRCMSMVRSLPAPEPDCISRPAKPLNDITSYLDSSNIYGSNFLQLEALRQHGADGLLDTSEGNLLPLDPSGISEMPCRAGVCYISGDNRVNEQSGLTVIHTIFNREHNRIAKRLLKRHPTWGDPELFQEARRILNAEWQHIVYNEWLPAIIGFDYADAHGLLPLQFGFSNYYDKKVNPTISNSFASAAFRFGHTMVRDMYDLLDANGQVFRVINVTSTFFEPTVVSEAFVGHARTLVARRSEAFDRNVASAIHEQLFTTNFKHGFDLLALNIQRGRDHGTPTYAQAAAACGVGRFRHWGDLNKIMDSAAIDRLRSVYDDVRDVDLFIGGISERLAPGAQVGPTFQCIIGQQFFDLRYGDRFFYDNGGLPHSFTEVQLGAIRKTSWARILCDNLGPEFGNDFTQVQPLAFLTTIGRNQVLACNTLAVPHVDMSAF